MYVYRAYVSGRTDIEGSGLYEHVSGYFYPFTVSVFRNGFFDQDNAPFYKTSTVLD